MFYKLALISDKYLQEREIFSNFVHNMKDKPKIRNYHPIHD